MRTLFMLLYVATECLAAGGSLAEEPKPEPKASWPDAFPQLGNYQRTFKEPTINKEKTVYQQAAHYSWTGNDYREATATLARDPEFKTAHTAEALKKAGYTAIKIGKKDAWMLPGKGGLHDLDKIIVPLAEDKALIVEGTGAAHKTFPTDLASKFDLEKAAAALDSPPGK